MEAVEALATYLHKNTYIQLYNRVLLVVLIGMLSR